MYFQSAHFPFGPQGAFYRGQFVIWPRVLIMMLCALSKLRAVCHLAARIDCNALRSFKTQLLRDSFWRETSHTACAAANYLASAPEFSSYGSVASANTVTIVLKKEGIVKLK